MYKEACPWDIQTQGWSTYGVDEITGIDNGKCDGSSGGSDGWT